jgi:hypothetical protein
MVIGISSRLLDETSKLRRTSPDAILELDVLSIQAEAERR